VHPDKADKLARREEDQFNLWAQLVSLDDLSEFRPNLSSHGVKQTVRLKGTLTEGVLLSFTKFA